MVKKTVCFGEQAAVPAIGLGTWYMGENAAQRQQEVAALRAGIDHGLTVIDTAEMYADGGAEEVVGQAVRGLRDRVVLVSKVYPWHAGGGGGGPGAGGGLGSVSSRAAAPGGGGAAAMRRACENSLRRLQTDYLDMYLLHWRGDIPLEETVEAMERLVAEGKIRRWGVSNLDTDDMQALWRTAGGERCATNQVLYHLASRGIEYDLLPWCQQHTLPVMAYCPLAQAGRLRDGLFQHTDIIKMANERGVTVAQLLLAWVIRHPGMLAIPKAASIEHVVQNAAALDLVLSPQELAQLDRLYPPPPRKTRLDMV
ncbi:MAG: aldo/keto reductase [Klebsiella sp.]|nr:aldo/keto reductase [Klebsiella sp.]MBZ6421052.1 aldo/keto reductase [Klebsiella sp.]